MTLTMPPLSPPSMGQKVGFNNVNDVIPTTPSSPNNDAKVFWSVNAFILFLIFLTVLWCVFVQKYLYNGTDRRLESDQIYRTRLQRRREAKAKNNESPEKRRQNLLSSFARHGVEMTVKKEDLISENHIDDCVYDPNTKEKPCLSNETKIDIDGLDEGNKCLNDIEMGERSQSFSSLGEETGQLKLATGMLVSNCCAVCLSSYRIGDTVTWSSNPKCIHAFHRDCVVDWLVKMQPETPCPCCRQEFTDLEEIRKGHKIQWLGTVAFDFNAIRFW